ncbi:Uncharacterized protein Rs2_35384 [Raphanus sativus]|nr:Uncharacterized protein Rs2_35384 [Raphanus sativus]
MGEDLGTYRGCDITPGSLKMRVEINGLLPLLKNYTLEFGHGKGEIAATLVYEKLDKHCSHCSKLDHEREGCPELVKQRRISTDIIPRRREGDLPERKRRQPQINSVKEDGRQISHRREELPLSYRDRQRTQRDHPYQRDRNKQTYVTRSYDSTGTRALNAGTRREMSYSREGSLRSSNRREERWVDTGRRLTNSNRGAETYEGRNIELSTQSEKRSADRERHHWSEEAVNLQTTELSPRALHDDRRTNREEEIPLEVLNEAREELRETMAQYTSCADPTESAARRMRVQQAEDQGEVEETAESMARQKMKEQRAKNTVDPLKLIPTRVPATLRLGESSLSDQIGEIATKQGRVPAKKRLGRPPLLKKTERIA